MGKPVKKEMHYLRGEKIEWWELDGGLHKEDGPAYITYQSSGTIEYEEWYRKGKMHREDGPARIWYRPDGTVKQKEWWLDGEALSCEEWLSRTVGARLDRELLG